MVHLFEFGGKSADKCARVNLIPKDHHQIYMEDIDDDSILMLFLSTRGRKCLQVCQSGSFRKEILFSTYWKFGDVDLD